VIIAPSILRNQPPVGIVLALVCFAFISRGAANRERNAVAYPAGDGIPSTFINQAIVYPSEYIGRRWKTAPSSS